MRERNTLLSIAALVGISLVPAVLLYWFFGTLSTADVRWANSTVKLGGPVAAFFAVLLLTCTIYFKLMGAGLSELAVAQPFAGQWKLTSKSNGSGRIATSLVTAALTPDGRLELSGNLLDPTGKEIGEWDSKEVFCTPTYLAYRYVITDKVSGQTTIGFSRTTIVKRDRRKNPIQMTGTWDVIGADHRDGTIEFKRADG